MFNTLPYNSFPASTAKFEEGKNDTIQAEIDAMKDGTNIDSFGDVETALSLKANTSDMEIALATKTNLSNIAPTFDATSGVYEIGDQVIYEGVLYEFTSAHSTAGDWDSSEVQAVKISELIDTLKSGLTIENVTVTKSDKLTAESVLWCVRMGKVVVVEYYFITATNCVIGDVLATLALPADFNINYFDEKVNLKNNSKTLLANSNLTTGTTIIGQIVGITY